MRFPWTDSKVAELRVMKKQLNLRSGSFGVGIGTHLPGSLQLHDDVQRQFAPVPYLSSKEPVKNDRKITDNEFDEFELFPDKSGV